MSKRSNKQVRQLTKRLAELETRLVQPLPAPVAPPKQRRRRRNRRVPRPVAVKGVRNKVLEGIYPEGATGIAGSKLELHEQGFIQAYSDPCGEKNMDVALCRIPDSAVTNSLAWAHRDQINFDCPWRSTSADLTNGTTWTLTLVFPPFMSYTCVAIASLTSEISDADRELVSQYLSGSIVTLREWVEVNERIFVSVLRTEALANQEWRDAARELRIANRGFTALLNAPTLVNQGRVVAAQYATDHVKESVVNDEGEGVSAPWAIWWGPITNIGLEYVPPNAGIGTRIDFIKGAFGGGLSVSLEGSRITAGYPAVIGSSSDTTAWNDVTAFGWSAGAEFISNGNVSILTGAVEEGTLSAGTTYQLACGFLSITSSAITPRLYKSVGIWLASGTVGTSDGLVWWRTIQAASNTVSNTSNSRTGYLTELEVSAQAHQTYLLPPTNLSAIVQGTPQSIQQLARTGDGVYMPLRAQQPVWNFAPGIQQRAIRVAATADFPTAQVLPGDGDVIDENFMSGIIVFSDISQAATIWLKARGMLEVVAEGDNLLAPTMAQCEPRSEEAVAIVREIGAVLPHAFPASYNCLGMLGGLIGKVVGAVPILGNVTKIVGKVVRPLLSNLVPSNNAAEHDFSGHEAMLQQMMANIVPLMQQFMRHGSVDVFRNFPTGASTRPMF